MAGDIAGDIGRDDGKIVRYHYARLDAFLAILRSRCLFQTDIRFLNDASEFNHAKQIFGDWLQQQGLAATNETQRLQNRLNEHPVFLTSFAAHGDSQPLWESYVGRRAGVSIEIDLSKWDLYETFYQRRIIDVVYANDFEQVLQSTNWIASEFFDQGDTDGERWLSKIALGNLAGIKHPSWSSERETRLVSVGDPRDTLYRSAHNLIIPYQETTFGGRSGTPQLQREAANGKRVSSLLLPISKVTVGPFGDADLISLGIEEAMLALGYDAECEIVCSELPLRH